MTKSKLDRLNAAGNELCSFCENDECEKCIVTRLLEDANAEYENNVGDEDIPSYCFCPDPFEKIRPDIIEYLKKQSDDYFTARKTTCEKILSNDDLIEDICNEFYYAMNSLGYNHDDALGYACAEESAIWLWFKKASSLREVCES